MSKRKFSKQERLAIFDQIQQSLNNDPSLTQEAAARAAGITGSLYHSWKNLAKKKKERAAANDAHSTIVVKTNNANIQIARQLMDLAAQLLGNS